MIIFFVALPAEFLRLICMFRSRNIVFSNGHRFQLSLVFNKGLLCLSIFCLINTIFYVIITQPTPLQTSASLPSSDSHNYQIASNKEIVFKFETKSFSRSILRLFLGSLCSEDTAFPVNETEAEEELKEVEYIYQNSYCIINRTDESSSLLIFQTSFAFPNTYLDTLKPPPKCVRFLVS